MSQAALGQTAADGIVVHHDFFTYLVACPLVCQSAYFENRPWHHETEDHGRLRDSAVFAAPEQHVASGESAEVHVHAYLSTNLSWTSWRKGRQMENERRASPTSERAEKVSIARWISARRLLTFVLGSQIDPSVKARFSQGEGIATPYEISRLGATLRRVARQSSPRDWRLLSQ